MMRGALERIRSQDALSTDVFEVVSAPRRAIH